MSFNWTVSPSTTVRPALPDWPSVLKPPLSVEARRTGAIDATRIARNAASVAEVFRLISPFAECSMPKAKALKAATIIVALQGMEHRPLLAERLFGWEETCRLLALRDVEFEAPATALAAIELNIETLMRQLRPAPTLPRVDVG